MSSKKNLAKSQTTAPAAKLKSPPYFTLQQAADELDADIKHLLSLGALGEAQIVARPKNGFLFRIISRHPLRDEGGKHLCYQIKGKENEFISGVYAWAVLSPMNIYYLDMFGSFEIQDWGVVDVLRHLPGNASPHSEGTIFRRENPDAERLDYEIMPVMDAIDPASPDFKRAELEKFVIGLDELYILRDEVKKLKNGEVGISALSQEELKKIEKPMDHRVVNSVGMVIAALASLADLDLGQHYKATETLLAHAAKKGLEMPSENTTAKYLAYGSKDQSQ